MNRNCPYCNYDNSYYSKYCINCGNPLDSEDFSSNINDNTTYGSQSDKLIRDLTLNKKSNIFNQFLTLIIILLIISLIFIFAFDFISSNEEVFYPTDDVQINRRSPEYNYAYEVAINIRNTDGGYSENWEWDGLIKFDLSSIDENRIVKSAYLNLYYYEYKDNNPANRKIQISRIIERWNEKTVNWNNQPDCIDIITDQSTVPISIEEWMQWDVTNDVQNMINGNYLNNGWKLSDEVDWDRANIPIIRFYSQEYQGNNTNTYSPYLKITFEKKIIRISPIFILIGILLIISLIFNFWYTIHKKENIEY